MLLQCITAPKKPLLPIPAAWHTPDKQCSEMGGLTSSAGVLMSMGSMTVNSFFTFFTVAHGRCSLAFTQ